MDMWRRMGMWMGNRDENNNSVGNGVWGCDGMGMGMVVWMVMGLSLCGFTAMYRISYIRDGEKDRGSDGGESARERRRG